MHKHSILPVGSKRRDV